VENIIDIIFSSVNLPLSIFTIILILYWLLTMISGIDFDLDIDVDAGLDANTGLESSNIDFEDVSNAEFNEKDVAGNRRMQLKWWQVFLIYFNFVGLPFMFTFTSFVFAWWFITLTVTTITHSYSNSLGFIFMLASFIPALIFTKVFTSPFKGFFKGFNKNGDKAIDFIGRKGTSLSSIEKDKLGNAEFIIDGNPMSVYIKSLNGEKISFREIVLIIKESEDKSFYYAQVYND
jgi:hypothetical protein|tara:strand:- start:1636 stop:2334 length:699 start_codon:yes stop_codon:yes gene_type:complete